MKNKTLTVIGCCLAAAVISIALFLLFRQLNAADCASCTVTVTERTDTTLTVTPVEGSEELRSSDKFSVAISQLPEGLNPQVGDSLLISYKGGILETYPASFADIVGIEVSP